MKRKNGFWLAIWAVLVVVTGLLAFGSGPGFMGYGPWHDWGQMGGWADDTRTFGGSGMGPGMMMGRGGPGMHGMMGNAYVPVPSQLSGHTPEQSQKLSQLQREAEERSSRLAQQLWAAQDKLNLLQMSEKRDWNAIRAASQTVMDLQRQQLDASIDLQQKIDSLLTDSQRQEMARSWRGYGWMGVQ